MHPCMHGSLLTDVHKPSIMLLQISNMRAFQFAMVLALAGLASVAGRSLKQTNGTTCTAAPGTICAPGTALTISS